MHPDSLLTQDELDFILGMQPSPTISPRDARRKLTLNAGAQLHELLTRLAANEQVTIQARFANQQMSFPLQLVEDEFHALHLELGTPGIYEDGPQVRPWRLALPAPQPLQTRHGTRKALWLHEISLNGALLEYRRQGDAPQRFSAWFTPHDQAPIALHGHFERLTEKGLAAYRLKHRHADDAERLRQYMLHEHRLAHPALHT